MMKRYILLAIHLIFLGSAGFAQNDNKVTPRHEFGFIENKGQIRNQDNRLNTDVRYLMPLPNNNIELRRNGFSYDTYVVEGSSEPIDILSSRDRKNNTEGVQYKFHRVDVTFVGSKTGIDITTAGKSSDYNVYSSADSGDPLNVYHYQRVTYHNIYPNIDIEFLAQPGSTTPFEYNFIVHPGGSIDDIKLEYNSEGECKLSGDKVELTLAHATLEETIPASYWLESKDKIDIHYREISSTDKKIVIGDAGTFKTRKNESLVIDPVPALAWGTLMGGSGQDHGYKTSIDASGNVYFVGSTSSTNNMATSGAHQVGLSDNYDGFLEKFNSAGVRQWGTYYGGLSDQFLFDVEVDQAGNIYACGSGVIIVGYIVKFSPAGQLIWEWSGNVNGFLTAIELDEFGNIYAGGRGSGIGVAYDFATPNGHQTTVNPSNNFYLLMKLNPDRRVLWATYYGDDGNEYGEGGPVQGLLPQICLDKNANVYLVGGTSSTVNMSSPDGFQPANAGGLDGLIVKFNTGGIRQWATYLGSTADDVLFDVKADDYGNLVVAGWTSSTAGIATAGAFQTTYGGGVKDGFIGKLNQSNGAPIWKSYYGGEWIDEARAITVDEQGNVYVGGITSSTTGISTPDAFRPTILAAAGENNMIIKFNPAGERVWGTYSGGAGELNGIEYVSPNIVYVSGDAVGGTGYTTTGAHQTTFGGFIDGFVNKITFTCSPPVSMSIATTTNVCAVKFNINKLPNCSATYSWTFGDGGTSLDKSPIHIYSAAGTYNASVTVSLNCSGCTSSVVLNKQVVYTVPVSLVEDVTVQVPTDPRTEVISTTASTFSDAWPLPYLANEQDIIGPFLNGSQGVWRNDGSYVYEKDRKLSGPTNIATDGTFTLEQFNWKFAEFNAVPNWVKATAMTKYSPYSFELENQDALGVYTGAIYDYKGQLPAANGVNMRQDEMAFTSFEYLDGTVGGNWILKSGTLPAYVQYKIQSGSKNQAIVEASLAQLQNVVAVDVITPKLFFTTQITRTYTKNEIICLKAHPTNPAWSVVVFKTAPSEGVWTGILRIKNIVTPAVSPVFEGAPTSPVHSGLQSLKITAETTLKQDLLRLTAGKSYWVNSWVSVNNLSPSTPVLASNLGIDIIAKQSSGAVISTFSFQPGGVIIEGWQQVKGSFICPANTAYIEIKFKPGSTGTAWFDDLRLQPEGGNMKGYVYSPNDFKLRAVLDEENFASFFYYDKEGNLYLTKKETVEGIKTLSENVTYQFERTGQ